MQRDELCQTILSWIYHSFYGCSTGGALMTIKGYGNSGHYFFSLECISGKEKLQAMPKISYPSIVSVILIKFTFTRRGFNVLHFLVGVGFTICIGHSKLTDREIDSKQLYICLILSLQLWLCYLISLQTIFFSTSSSLFYCVFDESFQWTSLPTFFLLAWPTLLFM